MLVSCKQWFVGCCFRVVKVPCEFGERVEQIIIWHMATSFGFFLFVFFFFVLFAVVFVFFLLNLKICVLRYSPPLKICLLK